MLCTIDELGNVSFQGVFVSAQLNNTVVQETDLFHCRRRLAEQGLAGILIWEIRANAYA